MSWREASALLQKNSRFFFFLEEFCAITAANCRTPLFALPDQLSPFQPLWFCDIITELYTELGVTE